MTTLLMTEESAHDKACLLAGLFEAMTEAHTLLYIAGRGVDLWTSGESADPGLEAESLAEGKAVLAGLETSLAQVGAYLDKHCDGCGHPLSAHGQEGGAQ